MKSKLFRAAAMLAALAVTGVAKAQSSAPAPERPSAPGGGPLDLKLDEAKKDRPRIQFGPAVPSVAPGKSEAASTLPDLGAGKGATSGFEAGPSRRSIGSSSGGPYPPDTNPTQ